MMQRMSLLCLALVPFICSAKAPEREIRHITPPQLDAAHLGKKILCHRPMRRGSPNFSVEVIEKQIVIHNYGHGGSGWTIGYGSAKYVIDLLLKFPAANDFTTKTPITIVGGGALGLFTAYELIKRGYTNITIVAESFDNLTSHNAGGLIAPVSMDNNPEMQKAVDLMGIEAYKFFEAIAKKSDSADFDEGAVIVPTYFRNREDSGLEPYVGVVMQPAKDVILDFGNGTTQEMVSYDDGIFIDPATFMQMLTDFVKPHVKFVTKKISNFSDVNTKYVFNCTGLGSEELNDDHELVSVQGHLIMLKDQNFEDLQHMILIYYGQATTESGQKAKRSFYMFPKAGVGVIGGTFIEHATPETPNLKEFDIMLQGAKDFYGIKDENPVQADEPAVVDEPVVVASLKK